jgi:hypothetical protein
MSAFIIALLMSHLAERYQCADDCYNVLDIDSAEFEDQARFELDWCIDKYERYYRALPGDHHSYGFKCWQADRALQSKPYAQVMGEKYSMTVKEMRKLAKYTMESNACSATREQVLREHFEHGYARQVARYDCWNAESEINYGPLGLGPYRKQDVDLDCWSSGWQKFYVKPDGTTD